MPLWTAAVCTDCCLMRLRSEIQIVDAVIADEEGHSTCSPTYVDRVAASQKLRSAFCCHRTWRYSAAVIAVLQSYSLYMGTGVPQKVLAKNVVFRIGRCREGLVKPAGALEDLQVTVRCSGKQVNSCRSVPTTGLLGKHSYSVTLVRCLPVMAFPRLVCLWTLNHSIYGM